MPASNSCSTAAPWLDLDERTLTLPFWIPTTRYHRFTGERAINFVQRSLSTSIGLRAFYWLIMKRLCKLSVAVGAL
jgi:hypothetical protein